MDWQGRVLHNNRPLKESFMSIRSAETIGVGTATASASFHLALITTLINLDAAMHCKQKLIIAASISVH